MCNYVRRSMMSTYFFFNQFNFVIINGGRLTDKKTHTMCVCQEERARENEPAHIFKWIIYNPWIVQSLEFWECAFFDSSLLFEIVNIECGL